MEAAVAVAKRQEVGGSRAKQSTASAGKRGGYTFSPPTFAHMDPSAAPALQHRTQQGKAGQNRAKQIRGPQSRAAKQSIAKRSRTGFRLLCNGATKNATQKKTRELSRAEERRWCRGLCSFHFATYGTEPARRPPHTHRAQASQSQLQGSKGGALVSRLQGTYFSHDKLSPAAAPAPAKIESSQFPAGCLEGRSAVSSHWPASQSVGGQCVPACQTQSCLAPCAHPPSLARSLLRERERERQVPQYLSQVVSVPSYLLYGTPPARSPPLLSSGGLQGESTGGTFGARSLRPVDGMDSRSTYPTVLLPVLGASPSSSPQLESCVRWMRESAWAWEWETECGREGVGKVCVCVCVVCV